MTYNLCSLRVHSILEKKETFKQMIPVKTKQNNKQNGANATKIRSTKQAEELQLALPGEGVVKKCFGKGVMFELALEG